MDAIRAQLDEFLGKDRNLLPKDRIKVENDFNDPDICKFFLCGLCPHELFTNANIRDLGPCSKLHDENCVKQYQNNKDKDKYDYEREWVRIIEGLISDNDKKIKRNKERLLQNPNGDANHHGGPIQQQSISQLDDEEGGLLPDKEQNSKITELDLKIQELLKKAEELGEEGQITEAQTLMTEADELKNQKIELEKIEQEKNENKRMSVCEICGALLFVGDKEKRSISHLEGKKHIGFQKIREVMEEYYKSGRRANLSRTDYYNAPPPRDSYRGDDRRSSSHHDLDGRRDHHGRYGGGGRDYGGDRRGGGNYNNGRGSRDNYNNINNNRDYRNDHGKDYDRKRERDYHNDDDRRKRDRNY
ncbi:hypothetical protein RB653_004451 [Dictyostelium firmibasis]|uniref:Uncharacterized protein n=1 Tax=Dictyostelium firmibasis TaxID=79012 RepID=A0AAN7Z047_9MYCE